MHRKVSAPKNKKMRQPENQEIKGVSAKEIN
jgi:hypothetical protein